MEHPICQLYKSLYGEKFLYDLLIQDKCEVDYEFPGFMDFYYHLSQIIPYDHTVLDLGCYIGLQSIYFRNHIAYIGVDSTPMITANLPNTTYHLLDINEFLNSMPTSLDSKIFAICSYVPIDTLRIRQMFSNVFCYYPT